MISDAETALIECERYCGMIDRCWGCSTHPNKSNQWNAITKCGEFEQWEGIAQGDITQKPGTILEITYNVSYKFLKVRKCICQQSEAKRKR